MGLHDPRLAEAIVFDALDHAARNGLPCPRNAELEWSLGSQNSTGSTAAYVVKRLERRGLIEVERYQRERRVTIVETGNQTAPVKTPAPHWRTRPRHVPTPSLTTLRQRDPDLTQALMVAARREGREFSQYLGDLVFEAFAARSIQSQAEQG